MNYKTIIAVLFGIFLAFSLNFRSTKKNELVLIWRNECFHIHHWITYGCLILAMYMFKFFDIKFIHLLTCFLLGMISTDILFYNDAFIIKEDCQKSFQLFNNTEKRDYIQDISWKIFGNKDIQTA